MKPDEIRERLALRAGDWRQIAKEAGVEYPWLFRWITTGQPYAGAAIGKLALWLERSREVPHNTTGD
jgi:hypothetical protein